jgi:hypothetical protein
VLSILTWHFYNVHVKRFNRSMFTGYISHAEMEEEHALELEANRARPGREQRRRGVSAPTPTNFCAGGCGHHGGCCWWGSISLLPTNRRRIATVPRQQVEVFVPANSGTGRGALTAPGWAARSSAAQPGAVL